MIVCQILAQLEIGQPLTEQHLTQVINTTFVEKSERQLASLRKEIRIMRELHHPHIATLQNFQFVQSTTFCSFSEYNIHMMLHESTCTTR